MTKETRGLALIAGIYFLLFVIPHFIHFSYGNQSLRMIIPLLAYIFLALFVALSVKGKFVVDKTA